MMLPKQEDPTLEEIRALQNMKYDKKSAEIDELLSWVAITLGALNELIELKNYKDDKGKDDLYLEQQPKVWHHAKEVIELWKKSDYGALPLKTALSTPSPSRGFTEEEIKELQEIKKANGECSWDWGTNAKGEPTITHWLAIPQPPAQQ